MLDRTYAERRCRTTQFVRTIKGELARGSMGTICYEIDNLGRQLIFVNWDSGISVPVFPDEIELAEECIYAA